MGHVLLSQSLFLTVKLDMFSHWQMCEHLLRTAGRSSDFVQILRMCMPVFASGIPRIGKANCFLNTVFVVNRYEFNIFN